MATIIQVVAWSSNIKKRAVLFWMYSFSAELFRSKSNGEHKHYLITIFAYELIFG